VKQYVQYKETGEIIAIATTATPERFNLSGLVLELPAEPRIDVSKSYVKNGEIKTKPESPSPWAVFDYEAEAWVEPGLTSEQLEVLKQQVRMERDILLSASDWTQVADAPVDKQAWAEYRQALRDVPQQSGFPESVTWPIPPK
jgi:hypothetical protein